MQCHFCKTPYFACYPQPPMYFIDRLNNYHGSSRDVAEHSLVTAGGSAVSSTLNLVSLVAHRSRYWKIPTHL